MTLATIAWKNIRERSLASGLTALSVALGVMLMVTVLVIYALLERTFSQQAINYNLIVGPKGSDLQLVLSTVYHVSPPIENLPYRYYEELKRDPRVSEAIPVALGDRTEEGGFPIVGTIPEYFEIEYIPGREFRVAGEFLRRSFDAVIGSQVARENGWKVGTEFRMIHGGADADHVHNEKFAVVGVLAPTGTPNDKTVFVNLEGFYQIEGHDKPIAQAIQREREFFGETPLSADQMAAMVKKLGGDHHHDHGDGDHAHHHHHEIPAVQKDVTSILVNTKTDTAALLLAGEIKKGFKAIAVNPVVPMRRLLTDILGNVRFILLVMTVLILIVSGVGIFVSIYNSMSERRREIGIMRALGAGRGAVFGIILFESLFLCLAGGFVGMALGHGLVLIVAPIVEAKAGVILNPLTFETAEAAIVVGLAVLGLVAGLVPAMSAYKTDVSQALAS